MKAFNYFIKAITFIPILTSILYIAGTVRMQEFLSVLDISYQLYDASVDKTIMDGFLNVFIISASPIIASTYAAIVLFMIMAAYAFLSESKHFQKLLSDTLNKLRIKENNKTETKNDNFDKHVYYASKITYYCLATTLVMLAFVFFVMKMVQVGHDDAIELQKKIDEGEQKPICIVTEKSQKKAFILYCSNSFCGFLIDKKSIVIPTTEISYIQSDLKSCIGP